MPWKSAEVLIVRSGDSGRHIVYRKKQQTIKIASAKARTGLAMAMVDNYRPPLMNLIDV